MPDAAKKTPLVIGFIGENANGSLDQATRYTNGILAHYGIEAHSVDLMKPDWSETLRALVSDRTPHFCYGYAGIGSALLNGDVSFWTAYQTPFLSLMYDHPFSHPLHHIVASRYVANCYFIGDFLETRVNYMPGPGQNFMMRDAVSPATLGHVTPPWDKRGTPYLLMKTGHDVRRHDAAIAALPAAERAIFEDCLSLLKSSGDYNLTRLMAEQCQPRGIEPHSENKSFTHLVLLLERYVRDWRSWQLVEWLKNKPALIIGDGWDHIDKENAVATFHPSVPATQCWDLYQNARFVFNANPCFRDGCHERVLGALQSGAVAVSDRNPFSDHFFAKFESFVGFDWADRDWRDYLDARLTAIEQKGGPGDGDLMRRHLGAEFSQGAFVARLLTLAQKLRDGAV